MNILESLQSVVNSDLGKTFISNAFPQPKALTAPVSAINPIDPPKKDYTMWIIGGGAALALVVVSMFIFRSKKG